MERVSTKKSNNRLVNNSVVIYSNVNNKKKTTTKEKIEKNSSSFLEDKTLKNYLQENIKDISTCKYIMKIVNLKKLGLERVKEVVEYAKINKTTPGYIVDALKNDWTIYKNKNNQREKECIRGQKVNVKAMNETVKAEKELENFKAKQERLHSIYINLKEEEKKAIDEEAYKIAVKECGVAVANVMVKTKYRYEILEKIYFKKGSN